MLRRAASTPVSPRYHAQRSFIERGGRINRPTHRAWPWLEGVLLVIIPAEGQRLGLLGVVVFMVFAYPQYMNRVMICSAYPGTP